MLGIEETVSIDRLWVNAYANATSYIASRRLLFGGFEVDRSMIYLVNLDVSVLTLKIN